MLARIACWSSSSAAPTFTSPSSLARSTSWASAHGSWASVSFSRPSAGVPMGGWPSARPNRGLGDVVGPLCGAPPMKPLAAARTSSCVPSCVLACWRLARDTFCPRPDSKF
eukprot:9503434-Pyramimonas_sp.AAC.1